MKYIYIVYNKNDLRLDVFCCDNVHFSQHSFHLPHINTEKLLNIKRRASMKNKKEVYEKIVNERKNIALQGYGLGLGLSVGYSSQPSFPE